MIWLCMTYHDPATWYTMPKRHDTSNLSHAIRKNYVHGYYIQDPGSRIRDPGSWAKPGLEVGRSHYKCLGEAKSHCRGWGWGTVGGSQIACSGVWAVLGARCIADARVRRRASHIVYTRLWRGGACQYPQRKILETRSGSRQKLRKVLCDPTVQNCDLHPMDHIDQCC